MVWSPPPKTVHGLEIRNANNDVVFSSPDTTWNYLGYFVAPAGEEVTVQIPSAFLVNTIDIQRSYLNQPLARQESVIHKVSYSEAGFRAFGGAVDTAIIVLGR